MEDFIFAPIVLMIGFGIHAAVLRQHTPREGQILTLSFGLHIAAGIGQVLLTRFYFGGGDMLGYFETAVPMADALRSDFTYIAPALIQGFLQLENLSAPVEFMPGGGSTQSMSSVAIWLLFFLGNSLYGTVLFMSVLSYASKVLLYRALRTEFPPEVQRAVLIGVTMLPTAVFWSSALLKEPVVMAMLGPLVLGLRWLLSRHRRGLAIVMVIVASTVISVIKPYVLMAMSIAASLFYLWSRLFSSDSAVLKPFALITAGIIGASGFVLGNRYFVKVETEDSANSFSRQRQTGYEVEGGSNFSLEGGGGAAEQGGGSRSVAYEFLLAPFAIFTSLFRPLIFEARNAVQLANALEASALLLLFIQLLRQRGIRGLISAVRGSPTLLFCAVFTLALALGTGLSSTNMGTLSRYRAPMMPFFFTLLLVLRAQKATNAKPTELALTPAVAAR